MQPLALELFVETIAWEIFHWKSFVHIQALPLDVPVQTLPLEVVVEVLALELSEEAIAKELFHWKSL